MRAGDERYTVGITGQLAQLMGVSGDQVCFVLSVLMPIPCGFWVRALQSARNRMILIAITGILFQYFLYGSAMLFSLSQLVANYIMILYVPRTKIGWTSTIVNMIWIVLTHLERMYNDYGGWHLGVNTAIMLQTVNLTSIAWDYFDGQVDPKKLHKEQQQNAVKDTPTFLEFFSQTLCPTQSFAGPSSNFIDFKNFIYRTGLYSNVPSTTMACLKRMGIGCGFIISYVTFQFLFPQDMLKTEEYPTRNWFSRQFLMFIVAFYTKSKYYIGWTFAEAGTIAAGQSFNGYDEETKEPKFDRFYSIDLLGVEFSVFSSAVTETWNRNGHVWLKRYVYLRLITVLSRTQALYLTYAISAFWHGFYPFYFLAFFMFAIVTENHKDIYRICYKYPILRSWPVMFFLWIYTHLGIDFLGMAFDIILYRHEKYFLAGVWWLPVSHLILFAVFKLTRLSRLSPEQDKERKEIEQRGEFSIFLRIYDFLFSRRKIKAA